MTTHRQRHCSAVLCRQLKVTILGNFPSATAVLLAHFSKWQTVGNIVQTNHQRSGSTARGLYRDIKLSLFCPSTCLSPAVRGLSHCNWRTERGRGSSRVQGWKFNMEKVMLLLSNQNQALVILKSFLRGYCGSTALRFLPSKQWPSW